MRVAARESVAGELAFTGARGFQSYSPSGQTFAFTLAFPAPACPRSPLGPQTSNPTTIRSGKGGLPVARAFPALVQTHWLRCSDGTTLAAFQTSS